MILTKVLRSILQAERAPDALAAEPAPAAEPNAKTAPRVLNVGGGTKSIPIPAHYVGWDHVLLDVDPSGNPDVVCDARELTTLQEDQFDAIYCSHNLEHYYRHDGAKVLLGFMHILKPDGFAEIRVPDITAVMRNVMTTGIDLEDTLYMSGSGPIAVNDVLYGWRKQIEQSGKDFYAHKNGFSPKSLTQFLNAAGFGTVYINVREETFEIITLAFKTKPTETHLKLLGLKA